VLPGFYGINQVSVMTLFDGEPTVLVDHGRIGATPRDMWVIRELARSRIAVSTPALQSVCGDGDGEACLVCIDRVKQGEDGQVVFAVEAAELPADN
jgi:hypothetical protein